jgi:hypothetical protein
MIKQKVDKQQKYGSKTYFMCCVTKRVKATYTAKA